MKNKEFFTGPSLSEGQLYLERQRINKLLEKAVHRPIVTVIAGAGYGKTHAVYSFVHKGEIPVTWILLTERDNIAERFCEDLSAAVGMLHYDAGPALVEFPPTERQFLNYLRVHLQNLGRDKKHILVFDDIHLIHNDEILRFIEHCATAALSGITSILISRTCLPINLMAYESKGLSTAITEEELRFSRAEMLEYFHIQNIRPGPGTADSIYRDTGGWAFAIYLAAQALRRQAPGTQYIPRAFKSNVWRLIESEIMAEIRPPLRKFLIKLVLLERHPGELLSEIGDPCLIAELKKIGSFIRLDSYTGSYQIHPLLREYLESLSGELSAEEKKDVWLKAARWCAANRQKINAIYYYEKAGDYGEIITLMYTGFTPLIPAPSTRPLLTIMERTPPGTCEENPELYLIRSWLYTSMEMIEKAEEVLSGIIPALEARDPCPRIHQILSGSYINLGFIRVLAGACTGNYDFVSYFEKAAFHARCRDRDFSPPLTVAPLGPYICRVNSAEKGEMERYIEAMAKIIPYLESAMGGCHYGMDELARGELAFFRADLRRAEECLLTAAAKARQKNQYEIENRALFYLMRIYLGRGNSRELSRIREQFLSQLDKEDFINRYTYFDITTSWFYIQTGRLAGWLKNDLEKSDLNSMAYGLELLVKAKYHFAAREYPAALAALQGGESRFGPRSYNLGRIEIKVLEALCRYRLGGQDAGFAALEEAWEEARPNGFFMPFIEQGKDMRALTGAMLKAPSSRIDKKTLERLHFSASAYAKRLVIIMNEYRFLDDRPAPSETLSHQELTILKSLSQGLAREEIAVEGDISINTVKSVIKNIYNKLGAMNRADAVRIAANSGFMTEPDHTKNLCPHCGKEIA
ncbi:MAG: LuxR C-terminal-related transcriptional regulator [Spirochaetaceae bacterium]|jgi:LuxR family maltose regulon positive regulatory protein|nr:LuxR C-terminal-related transcriptional regulator [Spirochaetaceae bacterium]